MEGQLPCLKFVVSESQNIGHVLGARNDNGETPKMLAERFYKNAVFEYINSIEWERDHPEEAESKIISDSDYVQLMSMVIWTLCLHHTLLLDTKLASREIEEIGQVWEWAGDVVCNNWCGFVV